MKSKIFLFGILAVMLSACGEEFLNVPSQTSLTSEVFFKTQADFTAAINANYAPLRVMHTGTTPVSEGATGLYILAEMHSDNARYILNPGFRATLNQENAADFITEASNTVSTFQYRTNYVVIARANQILATIDEVDFAAAPKGNIKGQALLLRAFSYLNLVQLFGSVPMHLTPVKTIDETALPLATADAVMTQILADAKAAKDLLPEKSAAVAGQITKGTARMVLANVYMIKKDYAAAETVLKEIVTSGEYKLMADYASIFLPANKNNSESIFEIQYQQGTDGYASSFFYSFVPYPVSQANIATLTGVSNPNIQSGGEGFNAPTPELIAAYEAGDKRYDASIGSVAITSGTVFPYCKKYTHPHLLLGQTNDNWPVYRYAEVLLYLAEAINEQNRPAEALTYINTAINGSPVSIRERAGLSPVTASTQADVRVAIAKERRVELAFENKRWFDLVRTGKAVETITAYGAKVKASPSTYYFPAGYTPNASAFSKIDLVWPLPADESLYSPYF